ncbi:MAG TPA: GNAT family N-acetyltransferase [Dehalococcoidia bacterium]|nr:GNAT family N-acetyltransferase [Dehalococcoidia bacterium]
MAVRQIRRLEPAPRDRWEWAVRKATIRAFWLDRERFERLRSACPARVIEEPSGVVAGEALSLRPEMLVHFAFVDRRACEERFGPMFNRLLDAMADRTEVRDGFVVEFTDRPNRAYVEPALKQQGFEVDREWLEFTLVDLDLGALPGASDLRMAEAHPDDAAALAEAAQAYGSEKFAPDGVSAAMAEGERVWWVERPDGARIGFVRLRMRRGGRVAEVRDLAAAPEYRGAEGRVALLGAALGQLRSMGAVEASTRVDVGEAEAIGALRAAGFRPGDAGVTYRRPADEEEVRRRLEAKRGHAVKFGDWR